MKNIYIGAVGYRIPLTLTDPATGDPINLTAATVTLKLYSFGDNTLQWSHACTVSDATGGIAYYDTVATDFEEAGSFYSLVNITKTGYDLTIPNESFIATENNTNSSITPAELLKWMDIPAENAKSEDIIQLYINQAESNLYSRVPVLVTTTNERFVEQKINLIRIKAAILYFMNSAEQSINPELRMQKIKMWNEEFNVSCDEINNILASTSTGDGVVRRVKNSAYSDPTSRYYEGDS